MLNQFPVVGWIVDFLFKVSVSVPFWFVWTICGVGTKYFYWLPMSYHSIPFWDCVGVFIVLGILKPTLTPVLVSVSQKNGGKDG